MSKVTLTNNRQQHWNLSRQGHGNKSEQLRQKLSLGEHGTGRDDDTPHVHVTPGPEAAAVRPTRQQCAGANDNAT